MLTLAATPSRSEHDRAYTFNATATDEFGRESVTEVCCSLCIVTVLQCRKIIKMVAYVNERFLKQFL